MLFMCGDLSLFNYILSVKCIMYVELHKIVSKHVLVVQQTQIIFWYQRIIIKNFEKNEILKINPLL